MKRLLCMVILASSLALFGCGGGEKVISGEVNNKGAEAISAEDTAEANDGADGSYTFSMNGTNIAILDEAEPIIEAIGEPLSCFEAPSCAFGDLDKVYTYGGVEIDTYQENGIDYISAVILMDDSVATPEGLSIGDNVDKIAELYGDADSAEGDSRIYLGNEMKFVVMAKGDTVTSIQYLNTMLD